MNRDHRGGFLLQELAINLAMTMILLGGLFLFLRSGIAGSQVTTARALLERNANHGLRQITEALLPAGQATLSAANAPLGSSFLDFQVPSAVGPAGVTFGPATRIEWRADPGDPADGADNDGDGLVDEGEVVIRRSFGTANEQDTVVATSVPRLMLGETVNGVDDNANGLQDEAGLAFERLADGSVRVRLTVQARRQGTLFSRMVETTVLPRN
jgi:hypothetical protein